MDLMWWDMCGFCDGRFGFLFGKERERRKTPTIFVYISISIFFSLRREKRGKNVEKEFRVFWRASCDFI